MQFDWSAIWPAIPLLIEGAKMTLWISVLGLAGGLVIGLLHTYRRPGDVYLFRPADGV